MQTDVHKTLYCFYTTNKMPHESTRSIPIFFKWGCILYEFATNVYILSSVTDFAESAHIHTTESEMDLNCQ